MTGSAVCVFKKVHTLLALFVMRHEVVQA